MQRHPYSANRKGDDPSRARSCYRGQKLVNKATGSAEGAFPPRPTDGRLKRVLGIVPCVFDTYKGDVVAKLVCSTRTELKLTKTRLAAMSGISTPTIRRLERTGCCQAPVLAKIVTALVSYAKARRMTQIVPVELVEIACNRMRRYRAIEQHGQTTSMC